MSASFGIHFGNTNCCIAVNSNDRISVVANPSGIRITPALVSFTAHGVEAGESAKQSLVRSSRTIVGGVLRCLGAKLPEEVIFPYGLKCSLVTEKKRLKFSVQSDEVQKVITQEDIIRKIFTVLKEIAVPHSTEGKLPSIISLPPWVPEASYPVITECATSIGFKVLNIITQPSASCLAFKLLEDNTTSSTVLTLHCGGTSMVVSVGEIKAGMLTILETSEPLSKAGDELTKVVMTELAKDFYQKYKIDPLENRRSKAKLFNAASQCKHLLSNQSRAQVDIDSLCEGVDFSTNVSRPRFELWVQSHLQEMLKPIDETLERCNLTKDQIDKVILSGGSCNIPKLRKMVSDLFPNSEILKEKHSPEEISAIGAAEESIFHMRQKMPKYTANPVMTSLSTPVYAHVEGHDPKLVFSAGSPTHSRATITYSVTAPFSVVLYESTKPVDCPTEDQILATVDINVTPANGAVALEFLIKSDCSLSLQLKNGLKQKKPFVIESERTN